MKAKSLWLLIVVSAAPVIIGWWLHFNPQWLPNARANHGTLVDPPEPLTALMLDIQAGGSLAIGALQGRWVMLLPVESCSQSCRVQLWRSRQMRLALGEGRQRVERLLVLGTPPSEGFLEWVGQEHTDLRVAVPGDEQRRSLQEALSRAGAPVDDKLYVIDPMGNLMMRYGPETSGEAMLKDFERLLKVSENWRSYASN